MKNTKWLCKIGTLAICSMLVGCGNNTATTESENVEIDETETVEVVEDTETVCEHEWVDATCSEPKHCSVCGETEGEALEHTLTEANYQQAATCEVCGETVGEPLQSDFDKYGLVCNAKIDTPVTYTVPDYDTNELTATGEAIFTDYEIFTSDDTHEAVEGYEWRAVTLTMILQNGRTSWTASDYYNVAAYDDEFYNEDNDTYTVNYNGEDYTECTYVDECLQDKWDGDVYTWQWRVYFRVPVGYDGRVIYVYTPENKNNGDYINDRADENTVIYRLQ